MFGGPSRGNPVVKSHFRLRLASTALVATDYDALGRAFRFTAYNAAAGGTIVNQVERVFNGFGYHR